MPTVIRAYVNFVDTINRFVGRIVMYMVFVMIAVLFYSSMTRTFSDPALWTLDVAQFLMVSYFILGGAYSIQLGDHVRMDLAYDHWSVRTRAIMDSFTVLFLILYLALLLYGAYDSFSYAWDTGQTTRSIVRLYTWPVKLALVIGVTLMLLQSIATFFRNLAGALGREI